VALDPDAVAWIDAVIAAGGELFDTESATKVLADDYFTALKTDSTGNLYEKIGRSYFPVWQAAAANAICAKSLTSGTFFGTVTHSEGFVQGDGSTGYFDPGTAGNLRTLGCSGSNLHYMLGISQQGSTLSIPIGVWDGNSNNRCQITNETSISRNVFALPLLSTAASNEASPRDGILVGATTSTTSRYLHRRKTAGTTVATNSTDSGGTNVPDGRPYVMARWNQSSDNPDLYYNGRLFAASYGFLLSQAQAEAYSLIAKQFYESLTGIAIP
jgi:hypothetical protein